MKVFVKISLDRKPSEISKFETLRYIDVELPLANEVHAWHESMANLYGSTLKTYITRRFGTYGFLFDMDDLLEVVDPSFYEGMLRARYYFSEALDSDLNGRDLWGDGWFDSEHSYNKDSWHAEVDAWLADVGETAFASKWHEAVDLAIKASTASSPQEATPTLRELGSLVRDLIKPWRLEEELED